MTCDFPWTCDHPKINAFISFPNPPSFIILSDLPLYMLLFVSVDVHIFLGTCSYSPSSLETGKNSPVGYTYSSWPPLDYRYYVLSLSSLAYQYFWGDLPCCFSGLLKLVREENLYMVRNWENVMIPASPSVCSDFGLAVTLGRAWNLVPAETRHSQTLGSFKR